MTYRLPVWMFLSFVLTLISCSDWTEVESLKLNTSTFEEQNPQLYADYLKDLIRYKSEEHKVLFVSFENPQDVPAKQAERLTVVPIFLFYFLLLPVILLLYPIVLISFV